MKRRCDIRNLRIVKNGNKMSTSELSFPVSSVLILSRCKRVALGVQLIKLSLNTRGHFVGIFVWWNIKNYTPISPSRPPSTKIHSSTYLLPGKGLLGGVILSSRVTPLDCIKSTPSLSRLGVPDGALVKESANEVV